MNFCGCYIAKIVAAEKAVQVGWILKSIYQESCVCWMILQIKNDHIVFIKTSLGKVNQFLAMGTATFDTNG